MKRRQIVKIDEKEIALKELSVIELLYICNRVGWVSEVPGVDFEERFEKQKSMSLLDLILSFASDISREEIVLFAPSEIQVLYDAFIKMNEVTFSTAKYFGVDKVLDDMKKELVNVFMGSYSSLAGAADSGLAGAGAGAKKARASEPSKSSSEVVKGTLVSEEEADR
ncbi:MAG: hypothetical protein KAS32_30525 [Candidatus Peribacteraceae bacterium]|nr:hypothetical protein [Candidatus Peribacteraceae bacterium]